MVKSSLPRLNWTNLVFVFEIISSNVFGVDQVDLSLSSAGGCGWASASLLVFVVDFLFISTVQSINIPKVFCAF